MRFMGKTIVISGAVGGIGTTLTRRFLDEGAQVLAIDPDEAALGRLSAVMTAGVALQMYPMDVSSEPACKSLAAAVTGPIRGDRRMCRF
jgi:NAD(P)-dependent dehydrogenase (short-subunit alcohol dehydrogenase family)